LISQEKCTTFSQYALNQRILKDVADMGYVEPTPIQAQCIPPALEGKDVIGLAQTGTGKTAAFGLPIIQRVAHKAEMAALILAPTRELARQIAEALRQMGKSSDLRVAVLVGGVPVKEDQKALRSWPNVLVATPGRLIDHIYSRTIDLSEIEILVVDEADRMHDMGFMPQIRRIVEVLPAERQTMMFTATMPADVEKLVRRSMRSPIRIQVGLTAPPHRAEQKLYHVQEPQKLPLLLDLLDESTGRVLVFVRTKRKVERVARGISRRHAVARLHGDREQSQRTAAMNGFREGKYRVLVATDIAARGLDVADIEHVINFDFPHSPEDYIHRIGRTARAAASGLASSFVTHTDRPCLRQVERLISTTLPAETIGGGEVEPEPQARRGPGGGQLRSGERSGGGRRGGGRRRSRRRGPGGARSSGRSAQPDLVS